MDLNRSRQISVPRDLPALAAKVRGRADMAHWRVHRGDIDRILLDERLVLGGADASDRMRSDLHVVYCRPEVAESLERRFKPIVGAADPNLIVNVVDGVWPFVPGMRQVWPLVAAVDLFEQGDERSRRVAMELFDAVDS